MTCSAFVEGVGEVASLNVQVVASFVSNLGVPRSVTRSAVLPLSLVAAPCPPLKDGDCRVTLNINQSPAALSVLFPGKARFCVSRPSPSTCRVHLERDE
jgi:hypothetical protein